MNIRIKSQKQKIVTEVYTRDFNHMDKQSPEAETKLKQNQKVRAISKKKEQKKQEPEAEYTRMQEWGNKKLNWS